MMRTKNIHHRHSVQMPPPPSSSHSNNKSHTYRIGTYAASYFCNYFLLVKFVGLFNLFLFLRLSHSVFSVRWKHQFRRATSVKLKLQLHFYTFCSSHTRYARIRCIYESSSTRSNVVALFCLFNCRRYGFFFLIFNFSSLVSQRTPNDEWNSPLWWYAVAILICARHLYATCVCVFLFLKSNFTIAVARGLMID